MEIKKAQAVKLTVELLVDHGLGDWRINFKDVTSYNAQTVHDKRLINISSRFLIVANRDDFRGVMCHEIAHALLGSGHGHGKRFKAKYYELTGDMKFAGYGHSAKTRKFLVECDSCKASGSTNRTGKQYCLNCWRTKKEINILKSSPNPYRLVEWK